MRCCAVQIRLSVLQRPHRFDYELHHGRAVSRNAVKLLGVIGFDNALIQKAEAAGAYFEAHNAWQPIGKNHVADDTTDER